LRNSLDANHDGSISPTDFAVAATAVDMNQAVLEAAQDSFGSVSNRLEIPGVADADKTFTFSNVLKWQDYFDNQTEGVDASFDESSSTQQWGVGGKASFNLDALIPDESATTK
jgi:hypothetical protein